MIQELDQAIQDAIDRKSHLILPIAFSMAQRYELKNHPVGCHCSSYCKARTEYVKAKMDLSRLRRDSRIEFRNVRVEDVEEEIRQQQIRVRILRHVARVTLDENYPVIIKE